MVQLARAIPAWYSHQSPLILLNRCKRYYVSVHTDKYIEYGQEHPKALKTRAIRMRVRDSVRNEKSSNGATGMCYTGLI